MGIEKHHSQNKHIHYGDKKEDARSSDFNVLGGKNSELFSEESCIYDLSNKLKKLAGQFISITISECSDIIQGRVCQVDERSLILDGKFGIHIIPICSISSIKPMH